jgi:hypothetical protein
MLARVAETVRSQRGPDEWSQALVTLDDLSRAAREAGDWELAADLARQMRDHDPWFAGTHYALALAAVHDNARARAREEFVLALEYWRQADPDLAEVLHAKQWLSLNRQ